MEKEWAMEQVYEMMGVTRQAVYQREKRQEYKDSIIEETLGHVRQWREKHPGMSAREMHYSMRNMGVELKVGINKFEQIVSESGFNALRPRSRKPKTSDGKGEKCENLTYDLELNDINQLIVTDITYYFLPQELSYIFAIKDVYSHRILSIIPAKTLHATHAVKAIKEVILLRGDAIKGCIHHSDNGSQYDSLVYTDILRQNGLLISRAKSCQENGSAEQLNHVVKNMYFEGWNIENFHQLEKACKRFKEIFNKERSIEELGRMSPIAYEAHIKSIPKNLMRTKTMFDFNKLI